MILKPASVILKLTNANQRQLGDKKFCLGKCVLLHTKQKCFYQTMEDNSITESRDMSLTEKRSFAFAQTLLGSLAKNQCHSPGKAEVIAVGQRRFINQDRLIYYMVLVLETLSFGKVSWMDALMFVVFCLGKYSHSMYIFQIFGILNQWSMNNFIRMVSVLHHENVTERKDMHHLKNFILFKSQFEYVSCHLIVWTQVMLHYTNSGFFYNETRGSMVKFHSCRPYTMQVGWLLN